MQSGGDICNCTPVRDGQVRPLLVGVFRMLQKVVSKHYLAEGSDGFVPTSLMGGWALCMPRRPTLAAAAVFKTNPRSVSGSKSYQILSPEAPVGIVSVLLALGCLLFNLEMLYLLVVPLGGGEGEGGWYCSPGRGTGGSAVASARDGHASAERR